MVISYSLLAVFTVAVISAERQAFAQVIDLVHSHVRGVVFNIYLQQQIEDFEAHFSQWLLLFDAVILILATIASYFLSGRTLAPIERAMQDQERFAADASHELRTPLASMAMEIEAYQRGAKTKSETTAMMSSLQEEIRRMTGMVDGLLKLVRTNEDGRKNLPKERLNWRELVEGCLLLVGSRLVDKHLRVTTDLAEAGSVVGNADELKQVVLILLDNAIKYTPGGGGVRVSTAKVGSKAELVVFNDGVDIPADDLPHIFDRFYRGATAGDEGSGLGLAIARTMVELYGGSIAVASAPGQGVTFRVRLKASE